ncbi:beta-lactamase family protein [Pseudomonadales bacterium]|nr:beta-lactamase family protein [Pseudomonadales bacterium]MDB9918492.1 beta-lactamase family protein [Pseudomonadales bacterium]MDC1306622.1 beta-lactamase family protein [Pseudomonadales bacterium]
MLRPESIALNLSPLPRQPATTPWPTGRWSRSQPVVSDAGQLQQYCDEIFQLNEAQGVTYALQIISQGELVLDRYDAGASAAYLQYSWSMAKSITHALVGILVRQGKLDIYAPAAVPEWQHDARRDITLDQLLRMSSGLEFQEDYIDSGSDVIAMLQFDGRHDVGAFAANKPLIHAPGSVWSYASGTTNIICRILKDIVGGGASGMLRLMSDELFEPLGIRSAAPKFDTSGTFIGSSYLFATPQDFARFGLLYLRGGVWDGQQILPAGWVDYARTPTYQSDQEAYGAQWWLSPDHPGWFYCGGYDGQRILCVPQKDLVIVRCGRTPVAEVDYIWERIAAIVGLF